MRRVLLSILFAASLISGAACLAQTRDALAAGFRNPPAAARPWTYWFWLNGNITRIGITKDLEAMARVGIGGVLIMEVDQGAPVGPVDFASKSWHELFAFACQEAARLGVEINMNDDAGWCGSGGPWITPELSMQKLVWTETAVDGGQHFDGALPQPAAVAGFYRDVAVLAVPVPEAEVKGAAPLRIADIEHKSGLSMREGDVPGAAAPTPPGAAIAQGGIIDLAAEWHDGHVHWQVPPGKWQILRFGHTSTGAQNLPAPATGRGLECDKLATAGADAQFAGFVQKLVDDAGPLVGKSLVSVHIDSWEVGAQNWTAAMRQEFQRLRGYDLLPYLPVLTGRVVDSLDVSERFLFDFRQTISDLVVSNYAGRMQELLHQKGLRLSIEAYGEPADDMAYAGMADEPMAEFWVHGKYGAADTLPLMTSMAHVQGKAIVGAEAFTANSNERWLDHPGSIKALGDWAFCQGINRFVFHRYALQPWADVRPGMSMGPWGLHYERTQTWWEDSAPWHQYLARCQYLLQQGRPVADICYLAPEGAPRHFLPEAASMPGAPLPAPPYPFDLCPADELLRHSACEDGVLVLNGVARYRLLVLPEVEAMTPELLGRVAELVQQGVAILGKPPRRSPSLRGHPDCDRRVQQLASGLWSGDTPLPGKWRTVGKGRVFQAVSPEQALAAMGTGADFSGGGSLAATHRRIGELDVWFVANVRDEPVRAWCGFRSGGRQPELWRPERGELEDGAVYHVFLGTTFVPLSLPPGGSLFVVFAAEPQQEHAVELLREGVSLSKVPEAAAPAEIRSATYGPVGDPARTRDVTAQVRRLVGRGVTEFQVAFLARDGDPAYGVVKTLSVELGTHNLTRTVRATDPEIIKLPSWPQSARIRIERASYGVAGDATRRADVRQPLQELVAGSGGAFLVAELARRGDPAPNVVKTLDVDYTVDGIPCTMQATDTERVDLLRHVPRAAELRSQGDGGTVLEAELPGEYEVRFASGKTVKLVVTAPPPPRELHGPWQVAFAPGQNAPAKATFPQLISWGDYPDAAVRYFSGAATYDVHFAVEALPEAATQRTWLDLGRVEVLAEVTLNGKRLGTLWHAPYRVDVSTALQQGDNHLTVRVVNLWVNRMIGDEQQAEDSERNGDGTLKRWPQWLQEGKPSPTGRFTFTSWKLWGKADPLRPSGLLGPVRLVSASLAAVR